VVEVRSAGESLETTWSRFDVVTDLREPANRVSPRARIMWLLGCATESAVSSAVVIVGVGFWDAVDLTWWLVIAIALLAITYVAVVPQWRYLVHRWEITETAVYTQRGWWARERRIAPMSRVQTVDYAQGPLSRLFGLATLTVTTASAAGPLRIDGLDRSTALALVDQLTRSAEAVGGDAT
jgi:membrane protein YdbS with pleckstrin-like domain